MLGTNSHFARISKVNRSEVHGFKVLGMQRGPGLEISREPYWNSAWHSFW